MVGLDYAGKTTILYKLRLGEFIDTSNVPTSLHFGTDIVEHKHTVFVVWDVPGTEECRPLWNHYFQNAQGVIFVVDSSDHQRMDETRDLLITLLAEDELKDAIFLVFANKQDLPHAMNVDEVRDKLELNNISNKSMNIIATSAITGQGLHEGLNWFSRELKKRKT